jgi:hypothetical protein
VDTESADVAAAFMRFELMDEWGDEDVRDFHFWLDSRNLLKCAFNQNNNDRNPAGRDLCNSDVIAHLNDLRQKKHLDPCPFLAGEISESALQPIL